MARIRTLETTSTVYLEWYQSRQGYMLELTFGDYHLDIENVTSEDDMAAAEERALIKYGLEVKAVGKDALSIALAGRAK